MVLGGTGGNRVVLGGDMAGTGVTWEYWGVLGVTWVVLGSTGGDMAVLGGDMAGTGETWGY